MRARPFEFSYDYQRADLEARDPPFYAFASPAAHETIYTSSGMAAISALLLGSKTVIPSGQLAALPGSYGETIEFIQGYCRHLQLLYLRNPAIELQQPAGIQRILLLDSCATAEAFDSTLRAAAKLDLIVFDTTCFSSGSRRIGRVINWARRCRTPLVLVRSHTKLDSLGLEYGRLGSAVFVDAQSAATDRNRDFLNLLSAETRKAIRLFGGAPLPAHFPPYVGRGMYRALTDRRIAYMLLNSRRTARNLAKALGPAVHRISLTHCTLR
jgi:hypothetical protein